MAIDDETVTLTEAAAILNIDNPRSARRALDRAQVKAVSRAPGRGGENVYRRADVESVKRRGRGFRTDRRSG
ncbi:hypothetical protein ACFFX1_21415 [Dactylosporangium sucinum]|uniref:Uncharacterized protein n=1 Tax=Dactylosporangium sucinum TaxID=1424081 RepID=A0A917X8Y1_9ACTN|nr:hypothetical protein [Dactylosporangium sucinum]GGM89869.1 hypothetical protein GCM10007977_109920 [Dactylosporangium sucinum]